MRSYNMSKVLKYNGYIGSVEFSIDDEILHGKIDCINDVVTYEADNLKDLKIEFENAVDDYLDTCKLLGKEPDKPLNGTFNVRVGEDLHKKAYLQAKSMGVTLNEFVKVSIQEKIIDKKEFHIHISEKMTETRSEYGFFEKTETVSNWEDARAHH